jgi:hypothetical protein
MVNSTTKKLAKHLTPNPTTPLMDLSIICLEISKFTGWIYQPENSSISESIVREIVMNWATVLPRAL